MPWLECHVERGDYGGMQDMIQDVLPGPGLECGVELAG